MMKKYGIGALVATLVVGIGIGGCVGFLAGEKSGSTKIAVEQSVVADGTEASADSTNADETIDASQAASTETSTEEEMAGSFAFDQEPVLTINDTTIYIDEVNARMYRMRDEMVAKYGEEPWAQKTDDGSTVADYAKQSLEDAMVRVTILAEQASNYSVASLTEEEMDECKTKATDYMTMLGADVAAQFSVTYDAVYSIEEKEALAMKVYNAILENLTEEYRAADDYKDMSDSDFDAVLIEKYNALYQTWVDASQLTPTETWQQLSFGTVG